MSEAFFPHPLNGVHHVARLHEEGIAEIGCPLDVVAGRLTTSCTPATRP